MVLSEARVGRGTMALLGCPREHRVAHETFPSIPPRILTLEPVRAARQPSNVRVPASGLRGGAPRLCCLWHQMLGLQRLSFLPQNQGNRRHLVGQRQSRPGRQHSVGDSHFVERAERTIHRAGGRGRALEHIFQLMAVVPGSSADYVEKDGQIMRRRKPVYIRGLN